MDILQHLLAFFTDYGYIAVFVVLLICGMGLPIPEDITLIAGGIICGLTPSLNVHYMFVVAFAGVLIGDGIMFTLGRTLGERVKETPVLRLVFTEKNYKKMQEKMHRYANSILFVARFLPGLRAPIYMTAGVSRKVSYFKFLALDGAAALISVPVWVYAGYYFAYNIDDLTKWAKRSQFLIVGALVAAVVLVIAYKFAKKRNFWRK